MIASANRTGLDANPDHRDDMLEVTALTTPSSDSDDAGLDDLRRDALAVAPPLGSLPAAPSPGRAALLDRLGDRLAFERGGVRLYEALMAKARAGGGLPAGPNEDDLGHIRDEEHAHVAMLAEAIAVLGGDPTAITPCADLSMVASSGLMKIVTDPRTTLAQCLKAALTAELVDNDEWRTLATMARAAGEHELAEDCDDAREEEEEHLDLVRGWVDAQAAAELDGAGGRSGPSGGRR